MKDGSGDKVVTGSKVTVHATGQVLGAPKPFWSTRDFGQSTFTYTAGIGKVIKGWDLGCLGMKVGEVRKLTIVPNEGYGLSGFPAWNIPQNATLVFEIQVVNVQ